MKKVFSFLLVVCVSLSLVACAGKDDVKTETTSEKVTASETTTPAENSTEASTQSEPASEKNYTDKNGNNWVVKPDISIHYLDMDQNSFANEIATEYDNELLYFSSTQETNSGTDFTNYSYLVLQNMPSMPVSVSVNIRVDDNLIPCVYVSTVSENVSDGIGCLIDTLYPIVEIMSGDKSAWDSNQKILLSVNLADAYDKKEQARAFGNMGFVFNYSDEVGISVFRISE